MIPEYARQAASSDTFEAHPQAFLNYSWTLLILGSAILLVSYFCLWTKTQRDTQSKFKIFYSVMITYSFVLHVMQCASSPIVITPYRAAVYSGGFGCDLGICANCQIAILFLCGSAVVSTNAALFYYRMDALLPPNHILNKNFIRIFFYVLVNILPYPGFVIIFVEGGNNQEEIKQQLFNEFGFVTEYLWDTRTAVYRLSFDNGFMLRLSIYLVLATVIPGVLIIVLIGYSIPLFIQFRRRTSKKTSELHFLLLKTLMAQALVYTLLFTLPISFIVWSVILGAKSNKWITIASCIFAASPSGGVFTMLIVNNSYRRFFANIFTRKHKIASRFHSSDNNRVISTVIRI